MRAEHPPIECPISWSPRSGPTSTRPALRSRCSIWAHRVTGTSRRRRPPVSSSRRCRSTCASTSPRWWPFVPSAGATEESTEQLAKFARLYPACRRIDARVPRLTVPCCGMTTTRPSACRYTVAAFGANVGEPKRFDDVDDLAERQVGQGRAHAAPNTWNEVTRGVAVTYC